MKPLFSVRCLATSFGLPHRVLGQTIDGSRAIPGRPGKSIQSSLMFR